MTEELEEMNSDLKTMNLAAHNKGDSPEERNKRLRSRTITVHGLIYAGTLLRIGNVTKVVENTMAARIFSLSEDLQEIIPRSAA
jgi:hypothetical protein